MQRTPWTTSGRVVLPGRSIPIGFARGRPFDPLEAHGERFRMVMVGRGAGALVREGRAYPFRAPACACLDEREDAELECSDVSSVLLVYFHPSIIRADFGFEALRGAARASLAEDAARDAYWLSPFLDRGSPAAGLVAPGIALAARIESLAASLVAEAEAQATPWWPCRTRSYLIEMLIAIVGASEAGLSAEPTGGGGVDDELVKRFLVLLAARYAERLGVDEVARELGTNRTTLQRRVAAACGRTVGECLASTRLDAASALLGGTMLPVDEVACRTGYADASSFSRAFRQAFGTAPSEYRRTHGRPLMAE